MIDCCNAVGASLYALGGCDLFTTTRYATCDKVSFSTYAGSAITAANLSQNRFALAAMGNPAVSGYIAGGSSGTQVATADKLTMGADTTAAATTANLSLARSQLPGVSERSSKGYFAGGTSFSGGSTYLKTADLLTFSGDATSAATTAQLSAVRAGPGAMTEGTTKGYFAGGFTGSVPFTTADKLIYSTDITAAQATANLSVARQRMVCGSDGSTKGYWAGGDAGGGGVSTIIDKLTFSSDTNSAVTSASMTRYSAAWGSDGTKAIGCGGVDSVGIASSTSILTFSTETVSSSAASLSLARQLLAGVATTAL